MNGWFAAAAGLSAFTCGLHVIVGGRIAARPLLAATDLGRIVKFTTYYCWHLVTIAIGALAVAFACSARAGAATDLAVFATVIAFLFAMWSLGMIAKFRLSLVQFCQWILFFPVGVLGLIGSLG